MSLKRTLAGALHQLQSGPSSIYGNYMLSEKTANILGAGHKSNYDQAKTFIKELPMSWRPALLIYMAQCAYEQKVFKPGGASKILAKWEETQDITEP